MYRPLGRRHYSKDEQQQLTAPTEQREKKEDYPGIPYQTLR
jgi:hypothetical protein